MRANKKLTLLVLALFLIVAIAGCGGKESDQPAKDAPILVGINCELSGAVASYGTNAKDGAVLAIEQVNAAGGVLGKQLKEEIRDCKSVADEAW